MLYQIGATRFPGVLLAQIKTIGANGQITLGTSYAGQSVAIEEIEPGVWIIKLGEFRATKRALAA
ncbi:hypothetical protein B1A_00508 [mine drainage metagenome]|uniref:Uncharacterized protein n=1 Tax=mine drainage metagenome TaxID=410659 RepID=T1CG63_9ZZZZ